MEGNKSKPRALLVFGAPCSGKTTFAEKFSKKFGLACYDFDALKHQDNFSHKQLITLLKLLTRTNQTLIIEGCLDTEKDRNEIRDLFKKADYDPALIWIQTDVATIRTRLKSKQKSVAKAKSVYEAAVAKMEAPTEDERPIILSGKHTFETQAKHVITGLADLTEVK